MFIRSNCWKAAAEKCPWMRLEPNIFPNFRTACGQYLNKIESLFHQVLVVML